MRTVFDNDMVAHLWANQSQEKARNSTGSLYFESATIFSYGSHFPIARIVTNKRGQTAVLFNNGSYSVTTSGHQNVARGAARHIQPQFTVPHISDRWSGPVKHDENLKHYKEAIQAGALAAKRAKAHRDWKLGHLEGLVQEANGYAGFFGLRTRFKIPSDGALAALIEQARKDAHRKREAEKRRQRERLEQLQGSIERWKGGEDIRLPWDCPEIYLRVRGENVQSSKGAEVPLAHAIRILPLIRSGKTYEHNGHSIHIGHFRVDKIDAQGNLTAGCHTILRVEIDRLAAQLGL